MIYQKIIWQGRGYVVPSQSGMTKRQLAATSIAEMGRRFNQKPGKPQSGDLQ